MLSVFLMLWMLGLCACQSVTGGESKENPLEILKGPITLSGVLAVGENEFGITLRSTDGKTGTVRFESPERMQGYTFEKTEEGYYLSYDDLRVPLKANTLPGGAGTLFSLLSPDVSSVTQSEEKANGIEMIVYTLPIGSDGSMKVYTKKSNGTPLRVEFDSHMGKGIFHISEAEFG